MDIKQNEGTFTEYKKQENANARAAKKAPKEIKIITKTSCATEPTKMI